MESSEADWDTTIATALTQPRAAGSCRIRIPIRREVFPWIQANGEVEFRDMLVDFAPYLSVEK